MQKIFEEYGGVIITVIAVVALIALVVALLAEGGAMHDAFQAIVDKFVNVTNTMIDNGLASAGGNLSNVVG